MPANPAEGRTPDVGVIRNLAFIMLHLFHLKSFNLLRQNEMRPGSQFRLFLIIPKIECGFSLIIEAYTRKM
ncbi:MAG: hypothetical protein ACI81T_004536 [Bacteroidia bacterium]